LPTLSLCLVFPFYLKFIVNNLQLLITAANKQKADLLAAKRYASF